MKKNKLAFIAVILICVIAIIISVYKVARSKTAYQDIPDQEKYQSSTSALVSADKTTQGEAAAGKVIRPVPFTDEEFSNWMNQESKQLEVRIADEKQVQADVQTQAWRLTESQLKDLKSVVENSEEPINKRIFSNYVLTNSFTPVTDQILNELINQSTDAFKQPQETHSADEVKRSQEYALRFMQIDEMVQRLQQKGDDPLAFLIDLSRKSNDSQIKSYAMQKIKDITGNK